MTPSRPYLIRALYEWIVDNHCTPHLLVDARLPGVQVPPGFVHEGRIILNVAPLAVKGLTLGNDLISFSARFGSVSHSIQLPVHAVLAIYARENGQGMMFREEGDGEEAAAETPDDTPPDDRPPTPKLRVVK